MSGHERAATGAPAVAFLFAVAALAAGGCITSSSAPTTNGVGTGSAATTLVGTMAGADVGGSVRVTILTGTPGPQAGPMGATAAVNASGTFSPNGGGPLVLSGSFDLSTQTLTLAGGGYSFLGSYVSGVVKGAWSRTPTAGNGSFILLVQNSTTPIRTYCGTFTSTKGGEGGRFNLVVQGTVVDGIACTSSGTEIPLQGSLGGTTLTVGSTP